MGCVASVPTNIAFVFVKPHAVTDATKELVKSTLEEKGIKILAEGDIAAEEIDKKKLIDQHYYTIASKATLLKPEQLDVPADTFKQKFGLEWSKALADRRVFNSADACVALKLDAAGLGAAWDKAKRADKVVKFGGGFYCAELSIRGKPRTFVLNGFFMQMRQRFVVPGASIHYYVVEWDGSKLPWAEFRGSVVGPTDPAAAPADSIRGMIRARWKALGLPAEPNMTENGVHASASPFEGLAERMNWLGVAPEADPFGRALVHAGVSAETIRAWVNDPVVTYDALGQTRGSLFEILEEQDARTVVDMCAEMISYQ